MCHIFVVAVTDATDARLAGRRHGGSTGNTETIPQTSINLLTKL